MTLRLQLFIGALVLLVALTAVALTIQFQQTRVYVQEQLYSHAADAGTSLGIAIQPFLQQQQEFLAEAHLNAMFDSGAYQHISVTPLKSAPLFVRDTPNVIDTVPNWFVDWVDIPVPTATAKLSVGWTTWGDITVRSNPRLAYEQLWQSTRHTLTALLIFLAVATLMLYGLIKLLLSSLKLLENHAIAITNRDFTVTTVKPQTRELLTLRNAMNFMAETLHNFVQSLERNADALRKDAYSDPLTGLGNQRALEEKLDGHFLGDALDFEQVHLLMIQLSSMDSVNQQQGFAGGDEYLLEVVSIIRLAIDNDDRFELFRARGTSLPILAVGISDEEADRLCTALCETFASRTRLEHQRGFAHIGVGHSGEKVSSRRDLLAASDIALAMAQNKGENQWHHIRASQQLNTHGEQRWADILRSVLERPILKFSRQELKILRGDKTPYIELLARFEDEHGDLIPIHPLTAMAERLGKTEPLDLLIVREALTNIDKDGASNVRMAVNISNQSLADDQFKTDLARLLANFPNQREWLVFEIPEQGLLRHPEGSLALINTLRSLGIRITIDNFGDRLQSLGLLRSHKPDYIKLSRTLSIDIADNPTKQSMAGILIATANGLGVDVFAHYVETEKQLQAFEILGCHAAQGFYVDKH